MQRLVILFDMTGFVVFLIICAIIILWFGYTFLHGIFNKGKDKKK